MIVERGIILSPTIQTGYRQIERLEAREHELTPQERKQLDGNRYKLETKLSFIRWFHERGATIVAGTDAIQTFGDYAIGLELLHRAGLSTMDVIVAATSAAARAIGLDHQIGTLRPGMAADLIYVEGDPLARVEALRDVTAVVQNGRLVVDKRVNLDAGIPALPREWSGMAPVV
jgi:imidazolonepropionase-like amidohydrolase